MRNNKYIEIIGIIFVCGPFFYGGFFLFLPFIFKGLFHGNIKRSVDKALKKTAYASYKAEVNEKKITFSDKNLQMYKNVSVSANYNRRSITVIIDVSKWSDWVMWPFFNPDGGDIIKYISDKKNPWTVSYSNRRFSILYQGGQKNGDKAHLQFRLIDSFPVNTEK